MANTWYKHRTPQQNKPVVNSDLYHKSVNDSVKRQELLDHLIELNTISWNHEHPYKGIYVNKQYLWNTKHPYIKQLLKQKLVKLVRDRWFTSTSSCTRLTYKEIIMGSVYITEVLRDLNDNPKLFETTYKKIGSGGPLGTIFHFAYTRQGKFLLPDGNPPFKPTSEPIGMTHGKFITEVRKFHYFCNKTLSHAKREQIFVQLCENIHPDEAKILIAIKDQKLHELYPNLTPDVVAGAGFIDLRDCDIEVVKKTRGRPKNSTVLGE